MARARATLLVRELTGAGARGAGSRGRPGLVIALTVALPLLFSFGAASFFGWIAASGVDARGAAEPLALLVGAGLLALLVFELQNAVSVVLLDSDLELLRRAPLRPRALFGLKLGDAFGRSAPLIPAFLLPPLLGYGIAYPLPLWGWLLIPPALLALWAVPLGLAVALALLVVSHLRVARARAALALLAPLTFTVAWLANSFLLPRLPEAGEAIPSWLRPLLAPGPPLAGLSPGAWVAGALAAAAGHDAAGALAWSALLALAGIAAVGIAAAAAAFQLEEAQARVAAPRGRARAPAPRRAPGLAGSAVVRAEPAGARDHAPSVVGAYLARDRRLLARDPSVLADVLTSALLWTLLPYFNLALYGPPRLWVGRVMLVTLAVALGYEVAARAVPFEREGLPWMKLAPIRPQRWLAGRLSGVAALSLAVLGAAAGLIAIALHAGVRDWLEIASLVLPALAPSLVLGIRTGILYGNPRWTNPRAMLGTRGRVLATLLLGGQVILWSALGVALDASRPVVPGVIRLLVPSLLATAITVMALRSVLRRVEALEWAG